jgi:hypothetical protein
MSPTNPYFNNFSPSVINEQRLVEDLVVETIRMYGHNVYYMPRETYDKMDEIYGEDTASKFSRAYVIEMYIANVEGYEGDGDFFSKFGLEIRDTSNFVVSRRSFERYVPSTIASRPREGDLVFVPVLNKVFEIKFVEEELMFFSVGKRNPYLFELRCEAFRYSNENINTGVEDVDIIESLTSYAQEIVLGNGTGNFIIGETVYQGANLASSSVSAKVVDWNPTTKKILVINVRGVFAGNTSVRGETSNVTYGATDTDTIGDYSDVDQYDNKYLQDEANNTIIIYEKNPLGMP